MGGFRYSVALLAALVFVTTPSPTPADTLPAATRMDITSAVDMAGRQRMLSQRMVKTYLMVGQGIASDEARSALRESIDRFEVQLRALKMLQPTPTVKNAIAGLEAAWAKCKPLLTTPVNKAGAINLYDASETLQKAAHSVTLAYEQIGDMPLDHLVNLAGRQRMLSQRMAKFYLYSTWDIYHDPADMELHLTRAHFTAVLNQIEVAQLTSPQIKALVAQLRREWEPYQQALFASSDPTEMRVYAPRVAELSERVLASTEELVAAIIEQAYRGAR